MTRIAPAASSFMLTGFYINLDRSPDRAAFMQTQLARLGMPWVQRHRAVDAAEVAVPPGCPLLAAELACFLSHLRVLQAAPDHAHVLVLEDDTELSDQLMEVLTPAVQGGLPGVDLLILECQPHVSLPHLSGLWGAAYKHFVPDASGQATRRVSGVDLLDARAFYRWGCPAYVVTPSGRPRLLALLDAWLRAGPVLPIDRHLEQAFVSGQLKGAITMPFLATTGLQWHGRSTIGNGYRVPDAAFMVLRRLLFAGRLDGIEPLAQSLAAQPVDPALQHFSLVLRTVAGWQRAEVQRAAAPPLTHLTTWKP